MMTTHIRHQSGEGGSQRRSQRRLFHFESGGDRWHHVEIRMAMAASAFGRLRHIWADSRLSRRLKLRIYNTYIVYVLTWGLPAWRLGDVERRKLAG
jgi:hypothetical protein